jgi:hypothetical protein
MKANSIWIWLTIAAIWIAGAVMSLGSPSLEFGSEPEIVDIAKVVDWFWVLIGTVGVLRLTLFRRPSEVGWGQDTAWPWILGVVGGIWLAAAIASVSLPVFELGDDIVLPVAAIIAPVAAAMLTWYACEFLVVGFAARRGGDQV